MKLILLITILIGLTSCGQGQNQKNENETAISETDTKTIDTTKIAIIHLDSTNNWLLKNAKPTDLTTQEMNEIDKIIFNCITDYNRQQKDLFKELKAKYPDNEYEIENFQIDIAQYFKQFVPTINENGEKEVWINCFCGLDDRNWRKEIIVVEDGGNCYFNLKFNLTTKKCTDLMVNGDA